MTKNEQRTQTPCVGTCSTVFGDVVCRGCKRFIHEVHHWNAFSIDEKKTVVDRLEKITVCVVNKFIYIKDWLKLKKTLEAHSIKFNASMAPHCWIHSLRNYRLSKLNWEALGLLPKENYQESNLKEIILLIDQQIFNQSEAWYEWSFKNPVQQDPNALAPISDSEH